MDFGGDDDFDLAVEPSKGRDTGKIKAKGKKALVSCSPVASLVAGGTQHRSWSADLEDLSKMLERLQRLQREAAPSMHPLVALLQGLSDAFDGCTPEMLQAELQATVDRACGVANAIVCESEPQPEARARANRLLASLYYIQQALCASVVASRIITSDDGAAASICDEDVVAGIARFSAPNPDEANRMQQLLLYLLNTAQARGYRRLHGAMYRRVMRDEWDTHAWERVCEMRDFVYEVTRKEVNYDMWLNLTAVRGNIVAAADHLSACHDVQLPDLRKDRHVFAFSNGIYLAASDCFVPYGSPEHAALPPDLVAAKYFGQPLPLEQTHADAQGPDDWYDAVATPHLQSILDYQEMGRDVSRWMYVMIGRLIYEVGEMDGWQVLPFLKGAASSGKSTILTRVCRNLYDHADVGTLSNNIERKFGLSALADKLLFIGPEIKADIQLEQAEFQSIVSGETVQVAAKYRTAQTVEWKVPGALAGNEVPNWVDNSGSINRRIVLFDFPRRVHNGDMELGRKIEAELPATLVKCNRAYLEAVRMHARENIWRHLPAPFHTAKDEFTESVNSIVHFLRSGQLDFDRKLYMPFENFAAMYEGYVASMGLQRMRLTGDRIAQPLLEAGCRVIKNETKRYPRTGGGGIVSGRFVCGCDVAVPKQNQQPADCDDDDGSAIAAELVDDLGDF